ncbi:hypothetical protein CYLTODRAFT_417458 [Cylindrobasidium torrendii FP15055 ss-10]|uniref:DOPA 4,5-dioxygenase n=1 Tax=Cylindrobasidium torrendii FP15055 ss-10 TaxID=1314674 RepID=A0A0D7BTK3_9AGAR|nr:hypothetical protein CYLTODRAFT_417458 [Cylindrobasidium torrendii FP15055 ss-10]
MATMVVDSSSAPSPEIDTFIDNQIKEWHFYVYFRPSNPAEQQAAMQLRDVIMKLVRAGAFVAVPLYRVHMEARGPHPVGSYEIWVPNETFAAVYGWLVMNKGNLSILVLPLTNQPKLDYAERKAWLGEPWPLDLAMVPDSTGEDSFPKSQYPKLSLGYNADDGLTRNERRNMGTRVAKILENEVMAAKPTW